MIRIQKAKAKRGNKRHTSTKILAYLWAHHIGNLLARSEQASCISLGGPHVPSPPPAVVAPTPTGRNFFAVFRMEHCMAMMGFCFWGLSTGGGLECKALAPTDPTLATGQTRVRQAWQARFQSLGILSPPHSPPPPSSAHPHRPNNKKTSQQPVKARNRKPDTEWRSLSAVFVSSPQARAVHYPTHTGPLCAYKMCR